ncbi:7-carboxy-7-deazaguanine synthase QueE [Pseudalkalibacillus salsuginis]|uniref:7-carboxy-7-deazaguanine synthase QueE n=1 Tax=Pseudalkalibacillus salsuginis TaxID=2910972 RepID=UPI001F3B5979|nr:radical SAM protein [Pseudalkalibacillus salsuginis]MCF6408829.1 radical SAM protein [Pseudalkalibacillus salsuginis]
MTKQMVLPGKTEYMQWDLPMVEIFETVEGEGGMAGFPTIFVRVFHCNLRCTWCDTTYSYAPAKEEYKATIEEIVEKIKSFSSHRICFTGGEPLIHGKKSAALLQAMCELDQIVDVHIETNGAIDLAPFEKLRSENEAVGKKARFIMDFKLPDSGEMERMIYTNFELLKPQDEVKFVIGNEEDFEVATSVVKKHHHAGQVLYSPVWETMPPQKLVEKILAEPLPEVKLSLQMHKVIWHPDQRGV